MVQESKEFSCFPNFNIICISILTVTQKHLLSHWLAQVSHCMFYVTLFVFML